MKRQSKHQHQIKTQILELTDLELKSNMKTMLRILIEKVDNMKEQRGNLGRFFRQKEDNGGSKLKST